MLQPGKLGESSKHAMGLHLRQETYFNRAFGHVHNLVVGNLEDVVVPVSGKLGEYLKVERVIMPQLVDASPVPWTLIPEMWQQ